MKKALASLLAAGMAASLLAGCGGSSSTAASTADTSTAASTEASSTAESDAPLEGEITFWHSFTQGARMEAVQKAADKFMEANPGVKINIETYSWGDFNTKWNAGLTTGDLPDMSTAQGTGEVVEMMNADVLTPIDDMVDDIGRDRFSANALADMTSDGATYGVPYYSHAQVMGPATRVTMTGGNVAHSGPEFGDEDDMLFLNLEFGNNTYAIVEYGSAFHWPEHYVLIQGTKGAIRIDMCNVGMTVKLADGTEEHYCVHANKEIDDDRTRIYHSTEMDGAIQYGHPGKKPPMWLNSIMNAEMEFFNGVMHGDPIPDEFKPLMTGEAARAAIATADAATLSLRENRKVSVEEVMK